MSNIKTIDINVSGLNPRETYKFNFLNKGGNWPVKVSPLSGIFFPNTLKTYIYFCPNTGLCPQSDDTVFYNMPSGNLNNFGMSIGSHSLYSVLELVISNAANNAVVYTHPCIVECDECLPELMCSVNSTTMDRETGSSATVSATVDGIIPNQEYLYKFVGLNGNWPIKIIPSSGIIKTSNSSFTLESLASFCSTTGSCLYSPSLFDYENMENCQNNEELYSVVEFNVSPINNNFQASTKTSFSITCKDCISQLKINLPPILELSNSPKDTITADIQNMIIGEKYDFTFEGMNANWPVIIYPSSGKITAVESSSSIPARITFCASTGICPPTASYVQPYTINASQAYNDSQIDRITKVRCTIKKDCSNNITYSNEMIVICNNCLPVYNINFTESPINILTSSCCSGIKEFILDVNNVIPNQNYEYRIVVGSGEGNLIPVPSSGLVSFHKATNNSLPLLIRTGLTNNQVRMLTANLKNTISGETATTTIAVKCGGNCS